MSTPTLPLTPAALAAIRARADLAHTTAYGMAQTNSGGVLTIHGAAMNYAALATIDDARVLCDEVERLRRLLNASDWRFVVDEPEPADVLDHVEPVDDGFAVPEPPDTPDLTALDFVRRAAARMPKGDTADA